MINRKPHSDWAGYLSERRNHITGDYTVIVDCKLAEKQGNAWVEDYTAEGGRYQIICNKHGTNVFVTNRQMAYQCMRDATEFCDDCREIEKAQP